MKYSDLHLKENQGLHSCFLCLGIGQGHSEMSQQQTLNITLLVQECLNRCPSLHLASFSTLILHLPFLLIFYDHIRKAQVTVLSP